MFVGRDGELRALEELYATDTFQFPVIYGRRRVGKTSLLRHFTEGKADVVFFTAQEATIAENLSLLSRELSKEQDSPLPEGFPVYQSLYQAFEEVFRRAASKRLVFVIDEYPYLAKSDPSASSALQTLIDNNQASSKLMLILCGSSLSFMEHQVLGRQSPLYGRRTAQLRINPFTAFDAARMLPGASPQTVIELYSIAGGVPLYLSQLDGSKSTEWNISQKVFRQDSILYEEPRAYLHQETRSPAAYNSIIAAIANGHVRPSEISDATSIPGSAVSRYLDSLIELKIIERCMPMVLRNKKQVVYRISDNLFRFWFRFVPRYAGTIEAGMGAAVAKRIMSDDFPTFVGPAFEVVCRQWLMREAVEGRLGLLPKEIGSWWGTDPRTRNQEEIGIVLEGSDGELVFGECKWKSRPVDVDVLDKLLERSSLLSGSSRSFFLFSKSGFTKSCVEAAKGRGDIRLVTPEEMFA